MAKPDETGTPPGYEAGISPQELVLTVTGRNTRLLKQVRPFGRIEED